MRSVKWVVTVVVGLFTGWVWYVYPAEYLWGTLLAWIGVGAWYFMEALIEGWDGST